MRTNQQVFPAIYTKILSDLIALESPGEGSRRKEELLSATALTPSDIEMERCQIEVTDQYRIINNGLQLTNEPGLGLRVGSNVDLMSHGILGIAALTSETLLGVFKTIARYYLLRVPICELNVITSKLGSKMTIRNTGTLPENVNEFLLEAYTSMFQGITEAIAGNKVKDLSFTLPELLRVNKDVYRQHFEGPLQFEDQQHVEIFFPSDVANHPCPTGDSLVHSHAAMGCKDLLDRIYKHESTKEKVAHMLTINNGTLLSLEDVASMLHMSRRTLIRKLKAEDSSFQELLDIRRQELSKHYLESPNLTVETIAHILGYSYVANFRRAFKRWFGISPREFRKTRLK